MRTRRLFFAETQTGWLPWAYAMANMRYERHRHWTVEVLGWQPLPKKPTAYLKEHILLARRASYGAAHL